MRDVGGREPLRPEIDGLYDAFQHSRASRVELPLLSPAEARAYVARGAGQGARRARAAARCAAGGSVDRRVRVRHDRAARAAARRDDARHPPAAGRRAGARTRRPHRRAARCPRRRGAGPGGAVHDGHVHRAVGAGQRAARARRRPARVLDRHRARSRTGSTPRSSTPAATTTRAGGASAGWAHRTEAGLVAPAVLGRATRTARGGGGGSACVEPVPADEPVVHVCCVRGRGLRRVGGQAAAHRGRVGEGGAVRPGHRPVAPLPLGRRRPDARARQPRAAPPAARPGGRLPARARRRWACTS